MTDHPTHLDDYAVLERVDEVLRASTVDHIDSDMMITGSLVIGLYTAPDGRTAGVWHRAYGAMNWYTQRGVLDYLLGLMRRDDTAGDTDG